MNSWHPQATRAAAFPFALVLIQKAFEDEREDVERFGPMAIDINAWAGTLRSLWAHSAGLASDALLADITQKGTASFDSREMARMADRQARLITEASQDALRDLQPDEIADLYDEWEGVRVIGIAENEMLNATSYGAHQQAIASGFVFHSWHNQGDDRVRSAHQGIATTALGIPYSTILGLINYPHDPQATIALTINCRCWETYER